MDRSSRARLNATPLIWLRLNPNGIPSASPGLAGGTTAYPGKRSHRRALNPKGVVSVGPDIGTQPPWGLNGCIVTRSPGFRVPRSSQPFARGHNPVGIEGRCEGQRPSFPARSATAPQSFPFAQSWFPFAAACFAAAGAEFATVQRPFGTRKRPNEICHGRMKSCHGRAAVGNRPWRSSNRPSRGFNRPFPWFQTTGAHREILPPQRQTRHAPNKNRRNRPYLASKRHNPTTAPTKIP